MHTDCAKVVEWINILFGMETPGDLENILLDGAAIRLGQGEVGFHVTFGILLSPLVYDGVSVTSRSRPIVLLRRPSLLGGYPVAATSAVRVFAAA